MSDSTALIAGCLIFFSLYTTFHLGIECERDRARKERRRRWDEQNNLRHRDHE